MRLDKNLLYQMIRYGIIGAFCALLDFGLFTLLFREFGIEKYIANAISIHAGIASSFLLNRKLNFKQLDRPLLRSFIFYGVALLGLSLSQLILYIGGVIQFPVIPSKLISIPIIALLQFVLNRNVTFREWERK